MACVFPTAFRPLRLDAEGEQQGASHEIQVKQEVGGRELPSPGSSKRRRLSQKTALGACASSFESLLPTWAGKCLAFQASGKTWLPTRPGCPASAFLGLPPAPWQVEVGTASKACVQRLSADQLWQLRGFFHKNSIRMRSSPIQQTCPATHLPRPGVWRTSWKARLTAGQSA